MVYNFHNLRCFIDVLAFVKEIGDLEEYGRDDVKKNKLRMVLTDNMLVSCDVPHVQILCFHHN